MQVSVGPEDSTKPSPPLQTRRSDESNQFVSAIESLLLAFDGEKLRESCDVNVPAVLEALINSIVSDAWSPEEYVRMNVQGMLQVLAGFDVRLPLTRRLALTGIAVAAENRGVAAALVSSGVLAFCKDQIKGCSYARDRFTYEVVAQILVALISAGLGKEVFESGVVDDFMRVFGPYFRKDLEQEKAMIGLINTLAKDQKMMFAVMSALVTEWGDVPQLAIQKIVAFVRDCIEFGQLWLLDEIRAIMVLIIKRGPEYEKILETMGTLKMFKYELDSPMVAHRYLGQILILLSDCLAAANPEHRAKVLAVIPTDSTVDYVLSSPPGHHLLGATRFLANTIVWEPQRVSELVPRLDLVLASLCEKYGQMQMGEKRELLRFVLNLLYTCDTAVLNVVLESEITEPVASVLDACDDAEAEFALKVLGMLIAAAEKSDIGNLSGFLALVRDTVTTWTESDNATVSALATSVAQKIDTL